MNALLDYDRIQESFESALGLVYLLLTHALRVSVT